jgi:hypothetical protein
MEDHSEKLYRFLIECFFHEEFKRTHFAKRVSFGSVVFCWGYFKLFNCAHPARNLVVSAIALGGVYHVFDTFRNEIFEVSKNDTPLAGRLRLYHQQASYNNIFIPFFKGETKRAFKNRENSLNESNVQK